jgi:site-specific DNA-cytosine methylase
VTKTYIVHPQGFKGKSTRVISVREAMSIMGFDLDFKFPENTAIRERYQMTVDSVSPVFSYVAALVMKDMLKGKIHG